jgi:hypothetical protein
MNPTEEYEQHAVGGTCDERRTEASYTSWHVQFTSTAHDLVSLSRLPFQVYARFQQLSSYYSLLEYRQ